MKKIMPVPFNKLKFLGYVLFAISCLIWCVIFILPFFVNDFSNIIFLNAALFIVSESCFVLSILILGKEFWQKIKSFFKETYHKIMKK